MSVEDQLGPEDRLAAMKLRTMLCLYQIGGTMSHDQAFTLPMEMKWDHPAAGLCIDEALRLVAVPHEKESGETDWTMLNSAREWLESDMTQPAESDDRPMTNRVCIDFLLLHAANDANLQGKCTRLWVRAQREIA